ncbi:MAG: histidine kinase [Ferruginibacter sp.]
MNQSFPAGKILKLALITSPFFGLFAAAPPLGRTDSGYFRIIFIFCLFSVMGFCFWMVNMLLYKYFENLSSRFRVVGRYVLSFAIILVLIFLFDKLFLRFVPPGTRPMPLPRNMMPPPRNNLMFLFPLMRGLAMNAFILILIELVLLRERKTSVESENTLLKLAHSEARNALLQRQLNPHFLFNSLSTLRSLTKRNTADAELYIDKLSNMLRFSIHNSVKSLVSLGEEIAFCQYYLDLQKMRFGDAIRFSIDVPAGLKEETRLPTFSLQLLVENAIKHNVLTRENPLNISIRADEAHRQMIVQNNYQPKTNAEPGNETGLQNLTERYRLLNAPPIDVNKSNEFFTVKISLIE